MLIHVDLGDFQKSKTTWKRSIKAVYEFNSMRPLSNF